MSDTFSKVEVIIGVAHRRHFSTDLKLAVPISAPSGNFPLREKTVPDEEI
jgi:hypothetical protein